MRHTSRTTPLVTIPRRSATTGVIGTPTTEWTTLIRGAAVAELQDYNTAEKVALYLGVSRSSIYRLTETGLMAHVKIGSLVRIRRQDVEAFLAANTHEAKA